MITECIHCMEKAVFILHNIIQNFTLCVPHKKMNIVWVWNNMSIFQLQVCSDRIAESTLKGRKMLALYFIVDVDLWICDVDLGSALSVTVLY